VRSNEDVTTNSKKQKTINLPRDTAPKGPTLFDDEWKQEQEQPPDRGDEVNRRQGYFYAPGNVGEWIVVKMIKRRTVTLSKKTCKKEKQVLVHWLYKNEKTWQREADVLPQLQGHYEVLLLREKETKMKKSVSK
jgi:hypothetical protein